MRLTKKLHYGGAGGEAAAAYGGTDEWNNHYEMVNEHPRTDELRDLYLEMVDRFVSYLGEQITYLKGSSFGKTTITENKLEIKTEIKGNKYVDSYYQKLRNYNPGEFKMILDIILNNIKKRNKKKKTTVTSKLTNLYLTAKYIRKTKKEEHNRTETNRLVKKYLDSIFSYILYIKMNAYCKYTYVEGKQKIRNTSIPQNDFKNMLVLYFKEFLSGNTNIYDTQKEIDEILKPTPKVKGTKKNNKRKKRKKKRSIKKKLK